MTGVDSPFWGLGDRVGKEMVVKFVVEIRTGDRVRGLDVQGVLIFWYHVTSLICVHCSMGRHGPGLGHSSSLNSHCFPVAFHLGMGSYEITPIIVAISAGDTVLVLFRWPYCWV